ncbi:hypothetical protein SLA2020_515660 [Shorea laevis]
MTSRTNIGGVHVVTQNRIKSRGMLYLFWRIVKHWFHIIERSPRQNDRNTRETCSESGEVPILRIWINDPHAPGNCSQPSEDHLI